MTYLIFAFVTLVIVYSMALASDVETEEIEDKALALLFGVILAMIWPVTLAVLAVHFISKALVNAVKTSNRK